MGLFFILAALILYVAGSRFLVRGSFQSSAFLMINLGFGYWYWLPSIPLLLSPSSEILYTTQITAQAIPIAAWTVLLYHFITVLVFLIFKGFFDDSPLFPEGDIPLTVIAVAVMISSALCFALQFSSFGVGQMISILTARSSAREVLLYFNHSAGAAESLLSLWQIINFTFAIFVIATSVIRKNLATAATATAGLAVALNFLASGTRTILLTALTVVVLSWLMRPAGAFSNWRSKIETSRFRIFYIGLLAGVSIVSFYGIAARFTNNGSDDSTYVSDSIINNNDMLRELAFVQENMNGYVPLNWWSEAINFLRTPFNTMIPSFMGFDKDIPYHLIVYNFQRAGIDLENGQGNVFPGIVADYYLVFGIAGPIIFALIMAALLLVVQKAASFIKDGSARGGVYATILVTCFVSFRNIQGSLAMIIIVVVLLVWLIETMKAPIGLRNVFANAYGSRGKLDHRHPADRRAQ